ncbi:MAG TPA: hypothetical protein VNE38_07510 [Ktedonobacteraceae bacterium]|nr:hypothetical protein [Ktedonobacteraceae bacterium]
MSRKLHARSGGYQLVFNQNVVYTALGILYAIVYIAVLLKPEHYPQPQYFLAIEACILGASYCVLRGGWRLLWLIRLELRRSAVLNEEDRMSYFPPTNPTSSETIPSEVKVRLKLLSLALAILAWFIPWLPWLPPPTSINWAIFLFGTWGIAFPIFYAYLIWQPTIKITERGLKRYVIKMAKTTEWSKACLFICYRLPTLIGKPPVIYYELSSQTSRITWIEIVNVRSIFVPWRPALPDEQYQRQMRALTALVTEKTGLPLYDLSEPWLLRKEVGRPKE